jgi:hypothetical protein
MVDLLKALRIEKSIEFNINMEKMVKELSEILYLVN